MTKNSLAENNGAQVQAPAELETGARNHSANSHSNGTATERPDETAIADAAATADETKYLGIVLQCEKAATNAARTFYALQPHHFQNAKAGQIFLANRVAVKNKQTLEAVLESWIREGGSTPEVNQKALELIPVLRATSAKIENPLAVADKLAAKIVARWNEKNPSPKAEKKSPAPVVSPREVMPQEIPASELTTTEIRRAFENAVREYSEPLTLPETIARFRKWLYLEDEGLLEVYLGTIAANLMDGDPVWLMIVGASGGGKTEPLNAAIRLPFVHLAATVTESSLLSGTPKREKAKTAKGGLLREVGAFGFLLLKDFTSMLAQRRDASAAVLSAFREIYDGSWTRHVGSDGGTVLHWSGKLAVIAGCTDTIDSHTAVIGTMGERFAFYRLPELKDARKLSRHALQMAGKEAAMRDELSRAVCGLFAGLTLPDAPPEISEVELERLIDLASLAARCRSAVERDNHTRDITLTLSPEAPTRIAKILRQLMHGMDAIGVPRDRIWTALEKVAFDSMHKVRRAVIETLLDGQQQATGNVAKAIQYPTGTARRALEELHAHGVVDCEKGGSGKSDSWQLSEWTRCTLEAVKAPNRTPKTTFPVFQTNDISFSSLEENEGVANAPESPAKYMHAEKRERLKTELEEVEL